MLSAIRDISHNIFKKQTKLYTITILSLVSIVNKKYKLCEICWDMLYMDWSCIRKHILNIPPHK